MSADDESLLEALQAAFPASTDLDEFLTLRCGITLASLVGPMGTGEQYLAVMRRMAADGLELQFFWRAWFRKPGNAALTRAIFRVFEVLDPVSVETFTALHSIIKDSDDLPNRIDAFADRFFKEHGLSWSGLQLNATFREEPTLDVKKARKPRPRHAELLGVLACTWLSRGEVALLAFVRDLHAVLVSEDATSLTSISLGAWIAPFPAPDPSAPPRRRTSADGAMAYGRTDGTGAATLVDAPALDLVPPVLALTWPEQGKPETGWIVLSHGTSALELTVVLVGAAKQPPELEITWIAAGSRTPSPFADELPTPTKKKEIDGKFTWTWPPVLLKPKLRSTVFTVGVKGSNAKRRSVRVVAFWPGSIALVLLLGAVAFSAFWLLYLGLNLVWLKRQPRLVQVLGTVLGLPQVLALSKIVHSYFLAEKPTAPPILGVAHLPERALVVGTACLLLTLIIPPQICVVFFNRTKGEILYAVAEGEKEIPIAAGDFLTEIGFHRPPVAEIQARFPVKLCTADKSGTCGPLAGAEASATLSGVPRYDVICRAVEWEALAGVAVTDSDPLGIEVVNGRVKIKLAPDTCEPAKEVLAVVDAMALGRPRFKGKGEVKLLFRDHAKAKDLRDLLDSRVAVVAGGDVLAPVDRDITLRIANHAANGEAAWLHVLQSTKSTSGPIPGFGRRGDTVEIEVVDSNEILMLAPAAAPGVSAPLLTCSPRAPTGTLAAWFLPVIAGQNDVFQRIVATNGKEELSSFTRRSSNTHFPPPTLCLAASQASDSDSWKITAPPSHLDLSLARDAQPRSAAQPDTTATLVLERQLAPQTVAIMAFADGKPDPVRIGAAYCRDEVLGKATRVRIMEVTAEAAGTITSIDLGSPDQLLWSHNPLAPSNWTMPWLCLPEEPANDVTIRVTLDKTPQTGVKLSRSTATSAEVRIVMPKGSQRRCFFKHPEYTKEVGPISHCVPMAPDYAKFEDRWSKLGCSRGSVTVCE